MAGWQKQSGFAARVSAATSIGGVLPQRRTASIVEHFGELEDPRIERQKQHQLLDVIVIAMCAVICGADDWVAIEPFGKAKEAWFGRVLALPNGIPSHDTFGRVFALLSPVRLQECCVSWRQAVAEVGAGQVIAIDGKTLRRSYDRRSAKAAIHMVSAWATQNRVVLGQLKTEEKANEITAIPELLKVLDVQGCIVTIDVMGCQKAIAQQIVEQGAEYVLALKPNQGNLYAAVEQWFQTADTTMNEDASMSYYETEEQQHGRVEIRRHWTTPTPDGLPTATAWSRLHCVGRVEAERHVQG